MFALTYCVTEKYPLNGIWTGYIEGHNEEIKVSMTFADEFCFIRYEVGTETSIVETSIERIKYSYESNPGSLTFPFNRVVQFVIEGNTLSFTHDGTFVILNKDTSSKAAPAAIRGVWRDREDWVLAFVNDTAYITRDNTTDYGAFTFDKQEGSLNSRVYDAVIEFSINGKVLDTRINGSRHVFSRVE